MTESKGELRRWNDWTDPDFFVYGRHRESRFLPLFLRQLLPSPLRRTKLTMTGWFLVVVSMGIGTAAYNTASNILFMTLSLLLSSLVLSGILSVINFRRLEWKLSAPMHLRCGEVGMAEVGLRNGKSIFPSMCLCFRVSTPASDGEERLYLQDTLAACESTHLEWTFIPQRRGRYRLCLSGVESQFPFGFLNKVMGSEQSETVLVWPEYVDYRFKPDTGGPRFTSGASRRRAGLGTDLLNLRPYVPGDAPRLIHWKATARLGQLVVRQLAMEGESGYRLYVNPDRRLWNAEQFERMCALVGSLAEDLYQAGRLEAVCFAGENLLPVRCNRDLYDFFDRLALLERRELAASAPQMTGRRWIRVRPKPPHAIAIYLDENEAGQTDC